MSRGFVKEGDQIEVPAHVPRAPLPPGVPNYVRPEGLVKLHGELEALQAEFAQTEADVVDPQARSARLIGLNARLNDLNGRIASARVIDPATQPKKEVRLGATVTLATTIGGKAADDRTFTIVGVDEADIKEGLIAFTSPLAKAVQGLKAGGKATLKTGRGVEEMVVKKVVYGNS